MDLFYNAYLGWNTTKIGEWIQAHMAYCEDETLLLINFERLKFLDIPCITSVLAVHLISRLKHHRKTA